MKLRITDVRVRTENKPSPLAKIGRAAALGLAALAAGCTCERPADKKPDEPQVASPVKEVREIPNKLVENRCTTPGVKEDTVPSKFATPRDLIRALAGYKDVKAEVVGEGANQRRVVRMDPLPEPVAQGICVGGVNIQIVRVIYTDGGKTGYSKGDQISMMIRLVAPAEEASPSMGAVPQDFLNGRLVLVPVAVGNEKFWMLQADVDEKGKITRWMNAYLPDYPFGQMLARIPNDKEDEKSTRMTVEDGQRFDALLTAANEILRKGLASKGS